MKKKKKKNRLKKFFKKIEFSKLIAAVTIFVLSVVAIYSVINFNITQRIAIQNGTSLSPVPEVAVECIRGILVTILIYCGYQFGNKNSRNKYGIDVDGVPYLNTVINWLDDQGITVPRNIFNPNNSEDDTNDIS